jgi:DNA-binding response OmpR family regulator
MAERILVVEDEPAIVRVLHASLIREGFEVVATPDGPTALAEFENHKPHLVLLDLRLPGLDGLEVARQIRQRSNTPIIMVTARAKESDKTSGLRWADDYVTKPFSLAELVARIHCVLRRAQGIPPCPKVQIQDVVIDLEGREAFVGGQRAHLTPAEFEILAFMAVHRGRVWSRCELLKVIDRYDSDCDLRIIDTHIKNLRRKIEPNPEEPQYIVTVYGSGYKFVAQ